MPRFLVILDCVLRGSSYGTTKQVIDAATMNDAEVQAVAAAKQARPGWTFYPLWTQELEQP